LNKIDKKDNGSYYCKVSNGEITKSSRNVHIDVYCKFMPNNEL